MAYIGAKPSSNFRRAPIKDSFTGDGSATTFDLANIVPAGGESKHVESGFPVGVRLMCDNPGGGVSPFNGGDRASGA